MARSRCWRLCLSCCRMIFRCIWCLLRCVCGWRRRKATEEDVDIEMGALGAGKVSNILVSERIRMLEKQHSQDAFKGQSEIPKMDVEEDLTGSSVAERRAVLQAARDKENTRPSLAPLPRKGSSSKALEKLRNRSTRASWNCAACGLQGGFDGIQSRDGRWFHTTCFRCAACGRSLADVPFGSINDNDDLLYCDENNLARSGLARSCLFKAKQEEALRHAEIYKEAENQRMTDSDLNLSRAAKIRAIDLIGDDLDKIIQGMAPVCAVCGSPFGPRDALVMQGMLKFHQDCAYRGGPTPGTKRTEPRILPKVALNDAPATLIFKLRPNIKASIPKKSMTFFSAKLDIASSHQVNHKNVVIYQPDPASRAPAKRKCMQEDLESYSYVRALGVSGNDIAPETLANFVKPDLLRATFQWRANFLDWTLTCDFTFETNTSSPPPAEQKQQAQHAGTGALSFLSATLTVVSVNPS